MANTIQDLYLKHAKNLGKLENDRYFQYLFAMIEASENTFKQQHQIMHKVVDENWLSTIEESLDAINRIIEKPRRFVARKEEVVPVDLAKRITADSVRHLSMNTQFIASAEGDEEIYPTRILNVTNEESYDLYENRFIYHLIMRLVRFIDKRTDIIFWSSGDETRNTLLMESKIDDAYEQIEYKVEMTIKNRQNFMESDNSNMEVFMRIDRVRRLVMALRNSSFCDLMSGCAKVRSPIQRTNLLMKDPDYKKCYKLWQFLESYDDVGYSIDVQNRSLEFDEEYMIQMYSNLITNYAVFKTITEEDERKIDKIPPKRRRVLKPKFIRKVEEEIVDDYDLPDIEVRQVLVEEVTQAQLDAEARLAEEIKAREHAEKALEEAEDTIRDYAIKAESALEAMAQAKEKEIAITKLQKKTEAYLNSATARLENYDAETKARMASHQAYLDKQMAEMTQKHKNELAEIEKNTENKLIAQRNEADAAYEEQKIFYNEFIATQKAEMEKRVSEMVKSHAEELEAQKAAADSMLIAQKTSADAAMEAQKRSAEAELRDFIAKYQEEANQKLNAQAARSDAELKKYIDKSRSDYAELKSRSESKTSELEALIAKLNAEKEALIKNNQELEYNFTQVESQLKRETEARQRAEETAEHETKLRELIEERAGAETLGDFIARSRAERKERRKQDK